MPLADARSAGARAEHDFLTRQHAIKRRAWEEHQKVLGRQESMNIRAPKRALNLSVTGTSSTRDIIQRRDGAGGQSVSILGEGAGEAAGGAVVGGAADVWAARAAMESCLGLVLTLQEAARKYMGIVKGTAQYTTPANLAALRYHIAQLRVELGEGLGIEVRGGKGEREVTTGVGGGGGRGGPPAGPAAAAKGQAPCDARCAHAAALCQGAGSDTGPAPAALLCGQ